MDSYTQEIQHWRAAYEASLRAEYGWLSIIALHWLEGEQSLGASGTIPLPAGRAPDQLGILITDDDFVRFVGNEADPVFYQGKTTTELTLELPSNGNSELFFFGDFGISVLRRGTRYGVRIYDKAADTRYNADFSWFPVDPAYRLNATFMPYGQARTVTVTNILGGTFEQDIPGEVRFEFQGDRFTLLPTRHPEGLSFVFKDLTSSDLTYPAARFLKSELLPQNKVILDFNKAHNPPCAYTPYATCPLPLPENHLSTRILAGEQRFSG
jgi:uncharacterized protein